jgi:hypothetical protein
MESKKIMFLHFRVGTTGYDFCVRHEVLMALTYEDYLLGCDAIFLVEIYQCFGGD